MWQDNAYHLKPPSKTILYLLLLLHQLSMPWFILFYVCSSLYMLLYSFLHLFYLYRMSWALLVGPHFSVIIHKAYQVTRKIWKVIYHADSALSNGRNITSHFISPQTNWCVHHISVCIIRIVAVAMVKMSSAVVVFVVVVYEYFMPLQKVPLKISIMLFLCITLIIRTMLIQFFTRVLCFLFQKTLELKEGMNDMRFSITTKFQV